MSGRTIRTSDGVDLYCEETGSGPPLIFVHELAGDCRSFEPQVRHFSRAYRCITYNARGYPPSTAPPDVASYSQARAVDDIRDVADAFGIEQTHLCGVSMGGSAVLYFGLTYPRRVLSLVVAGAGSGAVAERREAFKEECETMAALIERDGMKVAAALIAGVATRIQHKVKDPRGFAEFQAHLAEHSAVGTAATLRGVQKARGSLFDEAARLKAMDVPVLVVVGDEDEACLDASLFMKRTIRRAGLVVLPRTGHNLNLEEPALFNAALQDFFVRVTNGRWVPRVGTAEAMSFLGLGGR